MGIAGILPVQNRTLSVLPFHKMGQASFLSYLDKANVTAKSVEFYNFGGYTSKSAIMQEKAKIKLTILQKGA